ALAALALLTPGDAGRGVGPARPAETDPLKALNDEARSAYARARAEVLTSAGPVVLLEGDVVVLRRGRERKGVRFMPSLYHDLKAISHVPLAIHALRAPGAAREEELARWARRVAGAGKALEGRGFTKGQLARQRKILAASLDFLTRVRKRGRVGRKELTTFARSLRPLL